MAHACPRLTLTQTLQWTWIQTRYAGMGIRKLLYEHDSKQGYKEPVGPQPEQIRLLTHPALATGCGDLGSWLDRFLEDSHQGRDRWLMMALLNQEIPHARTALYAAPRRADLDQNIQSSCASSSSANRSGGGRIAHLGRTDLHICSPQGSIPNLTMVVDMVPEGSEPWEVSPGRVQSLQNGCRRVLRDDIAVPEFDLTTAIVFTNDLRPDGLVARWQDRSRKMARIAAQLGRRPRGH